MPSFVSLALFISIRFLKKLQVDLLEILLQFGKGFAFIQETVD